ncbi:probable DNA double-strand break repair Rad50 ATPase [Clytia hemisphaerica]
MQIRLNETREKLADTIQRKLDFEEAFKELKEDMEAVRDESNVERDRLNAMIGDTRAKIEAQQKINFEQSQEVEYYQQKSDEKDEQITEVLEKITFHEIRVKELENIVKDLSARLEKKCKENAALIESAAMCKDDHLSLIIRYREDKKKLENDITLLNSELQIGQNDYDNFQTQKIRAMHLLDAALLAGRKDKDEAEEMQKSLRNVKDDLLHQTSECTRLKRENIDLEIIIDQTKQDHLATIEVLQKQTNEYQTSLANERKGRVMLQHKRDDIQKKSSVFFMNYSQFATDITKEINEGKLAHQRQTRKGKDLQDGFKKAETQIKTRQEDLLKAKEDYVKLNKSLKGRANKLQKSINALEEDLKKRTEKYEQGVPVFKELQEMHKRKVEDYEKMKKHIVDIKSKKVDLENSVLKKQDQLHKLEGPKSIVYKELQEVRKEYKTQVHEETVEVRGIENEIFIASQRLNAIRKENKKFEEVTYLLFILMLNINLICSK